MITLAASGTLQGIAGTDGVVAYTVTGVEVSSGLEDFKVLAQGMLGNTVGILYTVPSAHETVVREIFLFNSSGLAVTGINLYVNGSGNVNLIRSLDLPPMGTVIL